MYDPKLAIITFKFTRSKDAILEVGLKSPASTIKRVPKKKI